MRSQQLRVELWRILDLPVRFGNGKCANVSSDVTRGLKVYHRVIVTTASYLNTGFVIIAMLLIDRGTVAVPSRGIRISVLCRSMRTAEARPAVPFKGVFDRQPELDIGRLVRTSTNGQVRQRTFKWN